MHLKGPPPCDGPHFQFFLCCPWDKPAFPYPQAIARGNGSLRTHRPSNIMREHVRTSNPRKEYALGVCAYPSTPLRQLELSSIVLDGRALAAVRQHRRQRGGGWHTAVGRGSRAAIIIHNGHSTTGCEAYTSGCEALLHLWVCTCTTHSYEVEHGASATRAHAYTPERGCAK